LHFDGEQTYRPVQAPLQKWERPEENRPAAAAACRFSGQALEAKLEVSLSFVPLD
jgi:hypothetical protein